MNVNFIQRIFEFEEQIEENPRQRRVRDRSNPFEEYEERAFKLRFRFEKETVRFILIEIGEFLVKDARGTPLTPAQQLFLALRFYATGAFQKVIGDTMMVHESTVCRAVSSVTTAICMRRNTYINFPIGDELRRVKNHFSHISGANFPGIVGCVDGTHIKISCPSLHQAAAYMNRKGFYSINCQIVCDGNLKIRNIVSRWPGSTHDSRIFRNSDIQTKLENEEIVGHLLGDSGYPCKRYLLTPIRNPNGLPEERYNRAHKRARNTVERAIGVWKRRFPCLQIGMRTRLQTTVNVIVATAALHNIALNRRDLEIEEENDPVEVPVPHVEHDDDINGNRWRRLIIQNHFAEQ